MSARALTLLVMLPVLAGCARLSTERARYAEGDVIDVHFDNRGPTIVRYWPCYPALERRVGDHWEPAHWVDADERTRRNPLSHACVLINYRLPPDERETWSVLVAPGSPSGIYRFSVTVRHRHEPDELATTPFQYVASAGAR